MKKIICFILTIVILWACDVSRKKLILINETKNQIYYRLLTTKSLDKDLYLDEIPPESTVMPDFVMGGEGAWERSINTRDSILYIFIFKTNKLNDNIIENELYEMKGWKVKELEKLNWTINYPSDFKVN